MTPLSKLVVSILAVLALLLVGLSTTVLAAPKVEVCHVPPGNPGNFHTIKVSSNALAAHLAHGDFEGACNSACAQICDDGDACTIDDTGDCEEEGCPPVPAPVDCNDSLGCTTDSCDSATGCANDPVVCTASDLCHVSVCTEPDGVCVETPVTCPQGEECNPTNGACEPVVACPCWTEADLLAINECPDNLTCPVEVFGLFEAKFDCFDLNGSGNADDLRFRVVRFPLPDDALCEQNNPNGAQISTGPLTPDQITACEDSFLARVQSLGLCVP